MDKLPRQLTAAAEKAKARHQQEQEQQELEQQRRYQRQQQPGAAVAVDDLGEELDLDELHPGDPARAVRALRDRGDRIHSAGPVGSVSTESLQPPVLVGGQDGWWASEWVVGWVMGWMVG